MINKIEELIKQRDIIIPRVLFLNYHRLNISAEEVLIISYLIDTTTLVCHPKKISEDLSIPLDNLMDYFNHLKEVGLLKIELKKVNNIRTECMNLDGLYNKLSFLLIDEEQKDKTEVTLFDTFEQELGRTLSPMEYEIINAWLDSKISEETIILALKEAVYNGVSNMRYIDKILNEWSKRGIKTSSDLDNNRQNYREIKKEQKENFDYDWLNDD